ncbi:MAG: efflux RND transporter permease subunit, partial [Bacillota bacterium]
LLERELDKIQAEMPEVNFTITADQASFINMAVDNVQSNLVVGGLLAVAILWVFLRSYKSTLIIALSIPISIIATFVLLYFSDLTLNLMTLGGLALGVGMLVDNSIVVIESIYQHLERGENPLRAAMDGTNEVTGAIIATTLTTVVVFLPIVFVGGLTGDIFRELSLTVSFSLLSSLVVSVTVVPMLSARMLSLPKGQNNMMGSVKKLTFYGRCLRWALDRPTATMGLTLVALIAAVWAAPLIGTEFLPATDEGSIKISGQLAEGSMLTATDEICRQIEARLKGVTEIEVFTSTIGGAGQSYLSASTAGSNEFAIAATLKPRRDRQRSVAEVVQALTSEIASLSLDARVTVAENSLVQNLGASNQLELTISAPTTEDVQRLNLQVQQRLAAMDGVTRITDNLSTAKPVIDVVVDRAKSMSFALTPAQVGMMVRGALAGQVATQYDDQGLAVDVRVRYREQDRSTVGDLNSILIKSPIGPELPLQELASVREGWGPVTLTRQNGQNSCTLTVVRQQGDLGSSIDLAQGFLQDIPLPPGASIKFDGAVELMQSGFDDLRLTMFLAIALVYMVMAAQFESFRQPLIIMLTLPLAAIGMVAALVLTGRHLGVTAFIGVVMLAGIVVDNAIVLLDCVNQYRARGMEPRNALLTGAQERLRPILMTTVTTILGLIPLAMGIGEGAELQAPLATVVIGGMVSSTILTLVIIPVIYLMIESGPQPAASGTQEHDD